MGKYRRSALEQGGDTASSFNATLEMQLRQMAPANGSPGFAVCQEHAARLVHRGTDSLFPKHSHDPWLSYCACKRAVLNRHVLRLGGYSQTRGGA